MSEEGGPPRLNLRLPAARETDSIWLRALNLIRAHPSTTLLPLLVTQLPLAIATSAVFFYLLYEVYPTAEFASVRQLGEAPNGLLLTMISLAAAQSLFSLVGGAATIVAVGAVLQAKPVTLAQSLDPAFTRMGGLLLFGIFFNALVLASAVGFFVLLYFVIRFGTVLQAYMLDGKGVTGAFSQGWIEMRGRMFRFMALLLTVVPLAVVLLFGTSLVLAAVELPFGSQPGRTGELALQSVAVFLGGVMFVPIGAYLATSTTMFYLSAREDAHA